MAETKIEWTAQYLPDGTVIPGYTFNPWIGCTRISQGCLHCYAETLMDTRYGKVEWGPQGERLRTSDTYWKQPLKWNRQAGEEGRRARVFCASLSDVFEYFPGLTVIRTDLWRLIEATPNLDWLLLTKRPEHIMGMAPKAWEDNWPAHVWIGTSVEDQKTADKRIPELLKVPAAVRFLSCEPLLGPIDLRHIQYERTVEIDSLTGDFGVIRPLQGRSDAKIHWVIVGGESGPNARPMNQAWARFLCDQCRTTGTAFFFKQWGEYVPRRQLTSKELANVPDSTYVNAQPIEGDQVYRVGKHAAGRLLDGREWNEFPGDTLFRSDVAELDALWPSMPSLTDGVDLFLEKYGPPTGEGV